MTLLSSCRMNLGNAASIGPLFMFHLKHLLSGYGGSKCSGNYVPPIHSPVLVCCRFWDGSTILSFSKTSFLSECLVAFFCKVEFNVSRSVPKSSETKLPFNHSWKWLGHVTCSVPWNTQKLDTGRGIQKWKKKKKPLWILPILFKVPSQSP